MNRTRLKNYAPQARRDFIRAVTDRAAYYGLTAGGAEPITESGDVAIIGGRAFPRAVARQRRALEERIRRQGFEPTMEAMAYTWFNRLAALRYMELHGYLEHGYRVLSHPEGKPTPEILEHAAQVELPGLDRTRVIDLKLDGAGEAELYRMLLIAQCNALHAAMPFLFDRVDGETELLLPDNLLYTDSLIRNLVDEIDEEDWREVEIIGWLYQFYISEKKEAVIGRVVKSEDLPAATQLFTPNWIVKYLVQNTLGRQWLATYPHSPLRRQMAYYIEPAGQTPEAQAQLEAITPGSLNPEELTLLDPACGSGHILVEAYDLFKAIYQERGYRARDIPTLILQKNLFGLEICERAAQLAAFALLMKARADDRRILAKANGNPPVRPRVMALVETKELDAGSIAAALSGRWTAAGSQGPAAADDGQLTEDIRRLIDLFAEARTFGSLIRVPPDLAARLPRLEQRVDEAATAQGELSSQVALRLRPLVQQARLLAGQYDCVVANPPYMGAKFYAAGLKAYVRREYKRSQGDLYTCFIIHNLDLARSGGLIGMITIPNWMFLSSFDELRDELLWRGTIDTFIHNGRGVFGSDFGTCSFVVRHHRNEFFAGSYRRLFEKPGSVADNEELEERFFAAPTYIARQSDFRSIPGQPIAYWISARMRQCFQEGTPLGEIAPAKHGMTTGDNHRFLRCWFETTSEKMGIALSSQDEAAVSGKKWFPYNKGGDYRRWYGNNTFVVNYQAHGRDMKAACDEGSNTGFRHDNHTLYFRPALTWSFISSSFFAVRCSDPGFLFDVAGSSAFPPDEWREIIAGFLCSSVAFDMMKVLNPTMNFQVGNVAALPVLQPPLLARKSAIDAVVREAVQLARVDWDSFETSWDFQTLPVLRDRGADAPRPAGRTLAQAQAAADTEALARFERMKQLEEENNRLFIEAYGLQDELSPKVSDDQITLARPDREQDIRRLLSYAVGCMMGRYRLDRPGLIYAHGGNEDFWEVYRQARPGPDPQPESRPDPYPDPHPGPLPAGEGVGEGEGENPFPPDADGILPITDIAWFPDDAADRIVEFISAAWPNPSPQPSPTRGEGAWLEENLKFVADSLGPNNNEQPRDTIRRYLATGFFKDHLRTYKRRPIYWLFSSGKQRAFQCLVYLHRYHDGTLARMRTEYAIPLQGKIAARIDHLTDDIRWAASTSHRKKLEKERDGLLKKQVELRTFDEKLRHYADLRIRLDLDDGVKVNYGKFGDLLAEVKAVTGGSEE